MPSMDVHPDRRRVAARLRPRSLPLAPCLMETWWIDLSINSQEGCETRANGQRIRELQMGSKKNQAIGNRKKVGGDEEGRNCPL